jgi:hypothetical protein
MQTDTSDSSPEVRDILESKIFDQSSPDHIRSDSLEVEKHLKSAVDALKWLQNNQQNFLQSSTQPESKPLWHELRRLAMNTCLPGDSGKNRGQLTNTDGPVTRGRVHFLNRSRLLVCKKM